MTGRTRRADKKIKKWEDTHVRKRISFRLDAFKGFNKVLPWFPSKIAVVGEYLLVEWVGDLTASKFRCGTFVVASTHEALEAEH